MSNTGSTDNFGYGQELKRELSFKDVFVYGMLFMVVIAPMSIYGYISKDSHMMAPFVYFVGICAMFFTALSYMKMSNRFPIAGSVYAYVQRGLNHHVGFIAGWLILLDYVFVPALLYLMTANWCVELFPATPRWMWVIVFVGINTLINVRGITYTARADWIMFYVEAVVLALFIGFGLNYVLGEGGGTGQLVMDPLYRPGEMNLQFIGLACTIACLSFLGFDGISTLAEETHRPEVTIGRATMAALLCIGFLFMLQTYVATIIQPDMSKMNPDTAFFDAAELAAGDWFRKVLLVVNILAVGIANTMNAQAATSRVLYGMSRDNVLPGVSGLFRKVHPRFQTPYIATIAVGIFSILVAELSTVEDLARLVNFGALTSFILLNLAVYNFFWRREKMRGGKALLNYVMPLLRRAHPRLCVALLRQHDPDRGLQLAGHRPGHRLRQKQGLQGRPRSLPQERYGVTFIAGVESCSTLTRSFIPSVPTTNPPAPSIPARSSSSAPRTASATRCIPKASW